MSRSIESTEAPAAGHRHGMKGRPRLGPGRNRPSDKRLANIEFTSISSERARSHHRTIGPSSRTSSTSSIPAHQHTSPTAPLPATMSRRLQQSRLGLLLLRLVLLAGWAAAACPFGFSGSSQQGADKPGRRLREPRERVQPAQASSSNGAAGTTGPLGSSPSPLTVEAAVRSYLLDIFRSDDSIPPLMVRLAWHDAGKSRRLI